MKIIYSPENLKHDPEYEFRRGKKFKAFETAARAKAIMGEFQKRGYGEVIGPDNGAVPIGEIHEERYINFLKEIHSRWVEEELGGELVPYCWTKSEAQNDLPNDVFGQLGFFAGDGDTPIVEGTWAAAYSAAACAATAARRITQEGDRFVFSLSRPPGHHASGRMYAGYCYFNNAAVACTQLRLDGFEKVALVDIDYHHGNGSQAIFEDRSDVLFISLHANPDDEYPFFTGRVHETGIGEGEGYNKNYPLERGIGWNEYQAALKQALSEIDNYGPEGLVVSVGADIADSDPLGKFTLDHESFREIGVMLSDLSLPTLFVMEGGYDYDNIGRYVYHLLSSFEQAISS